MMNRTQAKARAAELGISKDEARTFGNLNKTQTWLDAISAKETALESITESGESPEAELMDPALPSELQEEPHIAAQASEAIDLVPDSPASLPVTSVVAVEKGVQEVYQPISSVAEASLPMFPDPWDEPEVGVEPASNAWDDNNTVNSFNIEASAPPMNAEAADKEAEPALASPVVGQRRDSASARTAPDVSALVYPLLLIGLAVWAAYQLLLGLGSLVSLGLHHVAGQGIAVASVRLEQEATSRPVAHGSTQRPPIPMRRQAQLQPDG